MQLTGSTTNGIYSAMRRTRKCIFLTSKPVIWLVCLCPLLSVPKAAAFSLRAKRSRSNMTLHELRDMDYQAHKVHDAYGGTASRGAQTGGTHARSWNQFKHKHHGKQKKKVEVK